MLGTSLRATLQGFRRAVDRWGGRGGRGGVLGGVGEARRWLWPRERWSAATGSVRSREREGAEEDMDGGRDMGEWREVQGVEGRAWHPRVPPAASR